MIKKEIELCTVSALLFRLEIVVDDDKEDKINGNIKNEISDMLTKRGKNIIDFLNDISFLIEKRFTDDCDLSDHSRLEIIRQRQDSVMKEHPVSYLRLLAEIHARGIMVMEDDMVDDLITITRADDRINKMNAERRKVIFYINKDNKCSWFPRKVYDYYNH